MRKIIFTALIFAAFSGHAQKKEELSGDYSYKASAPYKVFDAERKDYFSKDGGLLAVKFDEKEVLLQRFDADKPAFIKEKKYEKFFPKNYVVEEVLEVAGRFYVFYSSWDGDGDHEQLFAVEMDFDNCEFLTPKLLLSTEGKVAGKTVNDGYFSLKVVDKFDIMRSHDKSNILIQYRKKPAVKDDKKSFDIIGLYAYDRNLAKVTDREVTMPYTERNMNNLDYQLDNKGNLYLLTKVFHDDSNKEKKKKSDTEANYHIELFTIKSGSDKIQISKFENKDKFINRVWMFDSPNNDLICGGFYSNATGDYDDCDGIVAFKMKEDGTIYDQSFHEIPTELLNEHESKKTIRKNEKKERKGESAQMTDMVFKHMNISSDGSMVLVGEQDYIVAHTVHSQNGYRTFYSYHYCDILVTKIKPDGSLGWMKKIAKNQMGLRGQGGMSYKYFDANNSHYFVFLDNIKNMDLPIDKEPKQHSDKNGGYLTSVKISDADGSVKKGSILNARDVEDFQIYQFAVSRIVKTSENTFDFEAYKKKKEDVLIKVTLN